MIAPLLPEIERRTGASESALGLALAAYALPVLFVSLPLGRLADRLGRRPLLLSGLLLTAAGSILIAVSSALEPLIAGRAVQGIGSAASWIAALAIVSDLAPPGRKGESIGFALAANSVGAIGGPALGGVTGEAFGFEFPFLLVTALTLVLAAAGAVTLQRRDEGAPVPAGALRPLLGRLTRPSAINAAVIVIAGATFLGLIEVVVPLDADARLGLSAATIGLLFAASIALDALAAPVAGRAGDRRGFPRVATVGLLVVGLSAALLALLPGIGGLAAALGVFGVGISVAFAAAVPWLDETIGELDRGLGYGILNILYASGYTVGPLAAGALLELISADGAYWAMSAIALGVAVLVAVRASLGGGRSRLTGEHV